MKEFKEIKSRENSLIKLTSNLQRSAKLRNETDTFVLEGLRICSDAYENGIRFDKLIVSNTAMAKYFDTVSKFGEISSECILVLDSLFKKISDTDSPQGIIALANKPANKNGIKPNGRYIALENIQDPSNLGAVARSCEALGADGILLSRSGCDPYSPKSLRASMGTLLRIPIFIFDNLIDDIKANGIKTYACVVDGDAIPINSVKFCGGCALLIGNEANGLTEETKNKSDYKITIPMTGKAESLNAAVAASISIWEMMK